MVSVLEEFQCIVDLSMHLSLQIVCRYDIVLIQEVRDASGDAIDDLLNSVNR